MHSLRRLPGLLLLLLLGAFRPAQATLEQISLTHPLSAAEYPIVLTGQQLTALLGVPRQHIRCYRAQNNQTEDSKLIPIAFQIDARDAAGRFQLPRSDAESLVQATEPLDENDELVLMAADLGEQRLADPTTLPGSQHLRAEITLTDPYDGRQRWLYVAIDRTAQHTLTLSDYVQYRTEQDHIETDIYQIGYAREMPLLIETIRWRAPDTGQFGPNMIERLKLRHSGKLFHHFPFERTHEDYQSQLVAVKDGPIRVIRSTANRVRMVLGIQSPAIYVDFIHYRAGYMMDIIVDLPFRIGLLFSDVDVTSVIGLKYSEQVPTTRLYSASERHGLNMDGQWNDSKQRYNTSGDTALAIHSPWGVIVSDMALAGDSPIQSRVYLHAANTHTKLAYDNTAEGVGFYQWHWERLSTATQHILFRSYMLRNIEVEAALRYLQHSPSFQ